MARLVELVGGGIAAVIGIAVAVLVATLGAYWWGVGAIALGGLGAGLGAYLHVERGARKGVAIIWLSSFVLAAMTILTALTVGLLLLPGTAAAITAAIAGSRAPAGGPPRSP